MSGKPRSRRVLIVDDDESVLRLIASVLKEDAISFDLARNGIEALELLARGHYALMLIDLEMPLFNGLQLLQKMKQAMLKPPIVFVVTGHLREHAAELDDSMVHAVIRKPFRPEDVGAMVRATLLQAAPA